MSNLLFFGYIQYFVAHSVLSATNRVLNGCYFIKFSSLIVDERWDFNRYIGAIEAYNWLQL